MDSSEGTRTHQKMATGSQVSGNKRECIEYFDNPYAEFCPFDPSPRKKMKTMDWTDESDAIELEGDFPKEDIRKNNEDNSISPDLAEPMEQQGAQTENGSSLRRETQGHDCDWNSGKLDSGKPEEFYKKPARPLAGIKFPCHGPGCHEEFSSMKEHDVHYRSRHCNICTVCKRSLKSRHLLDLHLMERHDSYFAAVSLKKPSFLCLIETCTQLFMNPEERKNHCLSEHPSIQKFLQNASESKIIAVEAFVREEKRLPVKPKNITTDTKMEEDVSQIEKDLISTKTEANPAEKFGRQVNNKAVKPTEKKKSASAHIVFGHNGARFIPRQLFGMQKKINREQKSTMETVDLSDLQQSLQC